MKRLSKNGVLTEDERRKRLSLQNIRVKSATQSFPDALIEKYGNKKNVDEIIELTFTKDIMHDFDVVPSFSPGSKSYYARIKEVVERLKEKLNVNIWTGPLDGFITDAHVYQECIEEAKEIIKSYKRYDQNIE